MWGGDIHSSATHESNHFIHKSNNVLDSDVVFYNVFVSCVITKWQEIRQLKFYQK